MSEKINFYGRRIGRSFKAVHHDLCLSLLPLYRLDTSPQATPNLLAGYNNLALEIGFGTGDHLYAQAAHNPQTLYLGCEPYMSGVVQLLKRLAHAPLPNIRIFVDPIEHLLPLLPAPSLDHIYILFPDPWPKKRHHKRRIIQAQNLTTFATYLKPDGRLVIASDHLDYQAWIEDAIANCKTLNLAHKERLQQINRPPNWPVTRFEHKAIKEGRQSYVYTLGPCPQ